MGWWSNCVACGCLQPFLKPCSETVLSETVQAETERDCKMWEPHVEKSLRYAHKNASYPRDGQAEYKQGKNIDLQYNWVRIVTNVYQVWTVTEGNWPHKELLTQLAILTWTLQLCLNLCHQTVSSIKHFLLSSCQEFSTCV